MPTHARSGAPARERMRSTSRRAAASNSARSPVMPIVETVYTKPVDASTMRSSRSSVEVGRRQEDPVEARPLAGGDPVGRGIGCDVGSDQPGAARCEQVVGVAVHPVLHHRVPVRHDEHGDLDAAGDLAHRGEGVAQTEAARERGLGGLLDDGAVHHGIRVRRSELEDVGAVLGEEHGGVDAGLQIGEAERQVADECASSGGVRRIDRRGDPRGHSSTPSPLASSVAAGTATGGPSSTASAS